MDVWATFQTSCVRHVLTLSRLMPVSTKSKRHKREVNRKEEMANQSVFKNLLEEALGPITQELKLSAKAKLIYRVKTKSTRRDTRRKIQKEDQRTRRSD